MDKNPKAPPPIGQAEIAAFLIMMAIMAYLGRDNPNFIYPQVLWSFLPVLALNLLNFSFLAKRFDAERRMMYLTASNTVCIAFVIWYSGMEDSYFWVLFLVPIFSAALFLGKRALVATVVSILGLLALLYRGYIAAGIWPSILEMTVKMATLLAAAVIMRRVSLSEQDARRSLSRERAKAINERLEARDKLQHLDRLATMGTLSASITHELNGPLSTILMGAELEAKGRSTLAERTQNMRLIQNSAQRCVQIVKDMLAFARQQEVERKPADLNALVAKCVALKQFDWVGSDVDVEEDYDSRLSPVTISGPQIQQVVFNLLTNAEQAIRTSEAGKGRIKVTTSSANGAASIMVEDNGPGIPKETLQKIGEPFFTTKPAGIGTGLGVSISKRIIEAHGGKLTIESDPGRRTVFTIELPKAG